MIVEPREAVWDRPALERFVADLRSVDPEVTGPPVQILEITDRAVLCLNLMDEAERHGIDVDARSLSRDLGIPVVPTVARSNVGLDKLVAAITEVATGEFVCKPYRIGARASGRKPTRFRGAPSAIWAKIASAPGKPPARAPPTRRAFWIAQVRAASTGVVAASMS